MEKEQYTILFRSEDRHWFFRGQWAIARQLIASQSRGDRLSILDAGCGTGGTTRWLSEFGTVIGIDHSKDALRHARSRNIPLVRGTVEALPFEPATFDLVT